MNKTNLTQAFQISEISFLSLFNTIRYQNDNYKKHKYPYLYNLCSEMEKAGYYNKNGKLIFPEYINNDIKHEVLPNSSCAKEYQNSIEFFSKNWSLWIENIKKKLQKDIEKSDNYYYLFAFLVAASFTFFIASCAIFFLCITQIIPTICYLSLAASILLLITSAITASFCLNESFKYNGKNISAYDLHSINQKINIEEIKREFINILEDEHYCELFSSYLERKLMSNENKNSSLIRNLQ